MGAKLFFALLVLSGAAFAANWEATAAIALTISVGLLGVAYMVGLGFGVNELQIMAKEEFYQVIATGMLVVLLVSGNNLLDQLSASLGPLGGASTLQQGALNVIDSNLNDGTNGVVTLYNRITEMDNQIALEGSKTLSCSIVGIGFTVSMCGGYPMLNTPMSMAGGILGFAIGELFTIQRLITISQTYALSLLLPFGIVLRTLKVTRGAGGFLIALGVSMHILLPMGIVFNKVLVDTFIASPSSSGYNAGISTSIEECDPGDVFGAGGGEDEKAAGILHNLREDLRKVMFSVLAKATFGPVLALLMMMAGLRALSSLAGAEVDVTGMARLV
ncbi:MAG: hypothetical protein AB1324_07910 [Candidatus Micrarchaeota archaeon]